MFRGRDIAVKYIGMIPSSLELNKLISVGLKCRNKKASNDKLISDDVINVKFNQKVDAGNQVVNKLEKRIVEVDDSKIKYKTKLRQFSDLIKSEIDSPKWDGVSGKELRIKLYTEGFVYNNIKYVPYKRSSAKSRVGQCLFIKEKLYEPMIKWSRLGLEFRERPKEFNIDYPSLLAYESLVGSSIENLIRINSDNILIIDDVDSKFFKESRVVKTGEDGYLDSFPEISQIKNSLFDGESLLDSQYFPDGKSMMLLRNHMFKSAAFNCDIQQYLKDHCPSDIKYENWKLPSMFKNDKMYAKDVHLIITPSSLKALKFSNLLDGEKAMWRYWKKIIKQDDCIFGVCKNEKLSKQGFDNNGDILQQTSYQMLNSLPFTKDDIGNFTEFEKQYIDSLKNDDEFYVSYLKENASEVNSNMMYAELYRRNSDVAGTKIFRDYRKKEIHNHVTHVKKGKIRLNGDYCVMLGNPLEYLAHAIGKLNIRNPKSIDLKDNEVYTKMFDEVELTGFRNPHTSPSNVLIVKNRRSSYIDKYFNLTPNIVCVNAIEFPLQDILSGSDYDSDTVLLIKNEVMLKKAKEIHNKYPVCINQVKSSKKQYSITNYDMALIDNELSKSQKYIGRTVNTGQLCMSSYWDLLFNGKPEAELASLMKKIDVVTVLSGICIDLAKKMFEINIKKEIDRIAKTKELKQNKPLFWRFVSEAEKIVSEKYNCPMDILFEVMTDLKYARNRTDVYFPTLLIKRKLENSDRKQEDKIVDYVTNMTAKLGNIHNMNQDDEDEINRRLEEVIHYYDYYISKLKVNETTMYSIILKIFKDSKTEIATKLLNSLFRTQKNVFLNAFFEKNSTV